MNGRPVHLNLGLRRHMLRLPALIGRRRVSSLADRARAEMAGLSEQHRALHRFLVAELPRFGKPVAPDVIAREFQVTSPRMVGFLDELGDKKALIARDGDGAVTWAYPVTVDRTPHHLSFKSGERLYAA